MGSCAASAGQVLSFAAVGFHGREWWTPAFALAGFGAAGRFMSSALMFLLAVAPAWSQPAHIEDFAASIAAAIPAGATVRLVCTGDDGRTQLELARLLAGRGIRLSELRDGTTTVRCSCLENLRERACIADIGDGTSAGHNAVRTPGRTIVDASGTSPLPATRDNRNTSALSASGERRVVTTYESGAHAAFSAAT